MRQNSKCRLCGGRDETINHISECSKSAHKEYKTRHEWLGKVIRWELCKKLKFDHMKKCRLHKPETIPENEMHKILWDFEIQTGYLISARLTDLVVVGGSVVLFYNISTFFWII